MTRHEDINIPKISRGKTIIKLLAVLLIPALIIAMPFFYGQGLVLENALTAIVVLFISIYATFFILNK